CGGGCVARLRIGMDRTEAAEAGADHGKLREDREALLPESPGRFPRNCRDRRRAADQSWPGCRKDRSQSQRGDQQREQADRNEARSRRAEGPPPPPRPKTPPPPNPRTNGAQNRGPAIIPTRTALRINMIAIRKTSPPCPVWL